MTPNRRFWLMKSEPGCYSIDDLANSPGQVGSWDGVRNYQARNFLRDEIKTGDGILFYHSNIKEPAIVGIAQVIKDGYPDHTALDPQAEHFDPRASEANPIWFMVDVRHVETFKHPLTRSDLQQHPVLSGMGVLRPGNRLSVMPVTHDEWVAVLELAGISVNL